MAEAFPTGRRRGRGYDPMIGHAKDADALPMATRHIVCQAIATVGWPGPEPRSRTVRHASGLRSAGRTKLAGRFGGR
jgi:hypothetical protein